MNETLEALARALFKAWFVDFAPFKGTMPEDWHICSLYEIAEFINGGAFKQSDVCDPSQGMPIVKITELKDGITSQTNFSMRTASPKQQIDTGDLLYSWSGSPDTSLDAFLWTQGPALLNQHIFKVVTKTPAEKQFLYYLLKFLKPTLVGIARDKQTTGLGHVTIADMKHLPVYVPSLTVLSAFNNLVTPLFDRGLLNTLENYTLTELKDALLPRLLSGELRVQDIESSVQA